MKTRLQTIYYQSKNISLTIFMIEPGNTRQMFIFYYNLYANEFLETRNEETASRSNTMKLDTVSPIFGICCPRDDVTGRKPEITNFYCLPDLNKSLYLWLIKVPSFVVLLSKGVIPDYTRILLNCRTEL